MNARKSRREEAVRQGTADGTGQTVGEALRTTLAEFVVGMGMRAVESLLEDERSLVCGPRYEHRPQRLAYRFGHAPGELVLGGRRVAVERPRARTMDGREVVLPS
jgi:hypothetical protein